MAEIVWQDTKRTLFGLPLSFTKYFLTKEKLIIKTGFLTTKEEEIRLYRIMDITLNRTLGQKIFKIGTINCISSDRSTPAFDIKNIKNSEETKEMLSNMIEQQRKDNRVSTNEFISDNDNF